MPTWFTLRSQMQSAAEEQPVVVTSIGYRRTTEKQRQKDWEKRNNSKVLQTTVLNEPMGENRPIKQD